MVTTTDTKTTHQLQVRQLYESSPERLFRAWTTPEELKRWHAPSPMTVPLAEVDLRVGGRYRIHMRDPEGKEYRVGGTYLIIDRPSRLVYTWKWDHEENETKVTLEFKPQGKGTDLVLTHEGFPIEDSKARHQHGWTSIFQRLAGERF